MAEELTRVTASAYTAEAVSSPPSVCSETGSESARSGRSRLSDPARTGSPQTARDKARVFLFLLSGCGPNVFV